jgi:DNA-binding MarR family transcriptional regulator
MRPDQKLLEIVNGVIDTYGPWRRLREIKVLLLIQQATAADRGISPSDLARRSEIPPETMRRILQAEQEAGNITVLDDPNDERGTLAMATSNSRTVWQIQHLMDPLQVHFGTGSGVPSQTIRTPYPQLISLIDTIMDGYLNTIRIRGARMALTVMAATLRNSGVPISDLARANDAPLETVRRTLIQHEGMDHIRFVEDPEDSRKVLVVSADLDVEIARVKGIMNRLADLDWSVFDDGVRSLESIANR